MIEIVAHRGGGGEAPENTLSAIQHAIQSKATGVEIDLRPTSDDTWVAFHDATIRGLAREYVNVRDITVEQIKELSRSEYYRDRLANNTIPTLKEVASVVRGRTILTIDLKIGWMSKDIIHSLCLELRKLHLADNTRLASPNLSILTYIHEICPEIELVGLSVFPPLNLRSWPIETLCVHWLAPLVCPASVQYVHNLSRRLQIWPVNSVSWAKFYQKLGIDSIVTDYPSRIVDALEQQETPAEQPLVHT